MMTKDLTHILVALFGFSLCSSLTYGQNQRSLEIQNVSIKDTFLVQQIGRLVNDLEKTDSLFGQGKGYLRVHTIMPADSGSTYGFHIFPAGGRLDRERNEAFPPYFTEISNRLVLLYLDDFSRTVSPDFSKKSKRRLLKLIRPHLVKVHKDFTVDFHYGHGSGLVLTYFRNKQPQVRKSVYRD